MQILEIMKISFMRNAFIVLLFVSSLLSYTGVYVLLKRIVFVGIAIAQFASLGYILGVLLNLNPQICSIILSLGGSVLFSFHVQEKRFPREAIIGLGYAFALGLGIIFISKSAHLNVDILNLLFGNILMVSLDKIFLIVLISLLSGIFYSLLNKEIIFVSFDSETAKAHGLNVRIFELLFYFSLAVIISVAISVIGVLLTFSLLLIPALASMALGQNLSNIFKFSIFFGIISSMVGLYISYFYDLPTGPTIVVTNIIAFGLILILKRLK